MAINLLYCKNKNFRCKAQKLFLITTLVTGRSQKKKQVSKAEFFELKFREEVFLAYKRFVKENLAQPYSDIPPVRVSKTINPFLTFLNKFLFTVNLCLSSIVLFNIISLNDVRVEKRLFPLFSISKLIDGFGEIVGDLFWGTANAQTIYGRVINNIGQGLNGKLVEAHLTIDGNYAKGNNLTNSLGYFTINNITDAEDEQAQTESITYTTENNSPVIGITTPGIGNVEIKMFDLTGQEIYKIAKETYGNEKFLLPTRNLANAIYFISTEIDGKADIQKFIKADENIFFGKKDIKPANNTLKKIQSTTLDSIIVSGEAIQTKTFHYGTPIGNSYNVGDLAVDSLYININGQVYKLFDWTQPNRGIEGATITIGEKTTTTGTNGTYSITIPSGIKEVTITHPNTWTRKTKIIANQNTTIDFDVMDKTRMPENVLAFYDSCSGRIDFFQNENILRRAINKNLLYYIVANINIPQEKSFRDWHILKIDSIIKPALITPMYPEGFLENINLQVGLNPPPEHTDSTYIIKMTEDPPGPGGRGFAYTTIYFNLDSSNTQYKFGETKSVVSRYWKNMPAFELNMDRLVVHEIISGIGGIISRYNSIPSVLNRGPPYDYRNMTETDKYWFLFTFNRMPGNRSPDTDYYIYNADNSSWIKPEEVNNYLNK